MFNKKAFGIHWPILILSFLMGIGTLMFVNFFDLNLPTVGEYPFGVSKALESTTIIPSIIERILEGVNDRSVSDLETHEDFLKKSLKDYDNTVYCNSLGNRKFSIKDLPGGIEFESNGEMLPVEDQEDAIAVDCRVDKDYMMNTRFRRIFVKKYLEEVGNKGFNNVDLKLSGLYYLSRRVVEENGEFINEVITSNGLRILINIEGEERGHFTLKPSFKFPVDYNFNDVEERCIFSAKCASCEDVKNFYSDLGPGDNRDYKIKKEPCDYYGGGCTEVTDPDNAIYAGKPYRCDVGNDNDKEYLCSGDCSPKHCWGDDAYKTDSEKNTQCLAFACNEFSDCSIATECFCIAPPNACIGTCLPYCSSAASPATKCLLDGCASYGGGHFGSGELDNICTDIDICSCSSGDSCAGFCKQFCEPTSGKINDDNDDTKCLDNPCSTYASGTCEDTSDCACLTGYSCEGECTEIGS